MYQKLVPVIKYMAKHIYFHCIKADDLIAFLGYGCYIYQYHNTQLLKFHRMDNIQIKKLSMLLLHTQKKKKPGYVNLTRIQKLYSKALSLVEVNPLWNKQS
jgi:hypothetical protein